MYGLDDASLQPYFKCREVLLQLGCSQSTFDPVMSIKHNESGDLIGMLVLHVDDFLHARNEDFRPKVSRKVEDIFAMGKTEQKVLKYVGFDEEKEEDGIRHSMKTCAEEKIDIFDVNPVRTIKQEDNIIEGEKSPLRKTAGRIGWLGRGARPDLVSAQVEMSTRFLNGTLKDLIRASKLTRKVKSRGSVVKETHVNAIVDKSTVDAIHSTAPVEDKKLRRDVAGIKQFMNLEEIRSVSWCPGKEQLADCMAKRTSSDFNLMQVLKSGRR